MDYFNALLSVNKASLVFLVITIVFIGYEFYLFRKDRGHLTNVPLKSRKQEEKKTAIKAIKAPEIRAASTKAPKAHFKSKNLLVIGGSLMAVFVLLLLFAYFSSRTQEEKFTTSSRAAVPTLPLPTSTPTPLPTATPEPTAEPSPELLAQASPSPEEEEEEVVVASETPTVAPTEEELPVTGNVFYPVIIFTAAGLIFFLSFIL